MDDSDDDNDSQNSEIKSISSPSKGNDQSLRGDGMNTDNHLVKGKKDG